MRDFWNDRSPRERLLIAIAGILAVFVIVMQLVLLPAMRAKESAQVSADRAAKTLDALSRQAPIAPASSAPGAGTKDPDAIRRAVLESANSRDLTISRVLVDDQGSVVVQVDDAPAATVFGWLLDVRRSSNAQILRASMNDSGNGFVRSSFEFGGTQD